MSAPLGLRLIIDPRSSRADAIDLFPVDGEYAAAIAAVAHQTDIPDEVFLHEYAYEMLERLRENVLLGGRTFQAPFWPEALFDGADISAHAAREIQGMFPAFAAIHVARADAREVAAAETRVLGAVRVDPKEYALHLQAACVRVGARDEGASFERATAAGFLIRDGRVLLERRPDDARTYPGMWDTPGGHLDAGEAPESALLRELQEELAVDPLAFELVLVQDDDDPVRAGAAYRHFLYLVWDWRGEVRAAEGQRIEWFDVPSAMILNGLNPLIRAALSELVLTGRFGPDLNS